MGAVLPSRDVLNGQLAGIVASPLVTLTRGLGSMISGLAIALQQVADQGLVGGTAEEAPAAAPDAEEAPAEEAEAAEPAAEEAPADEAEASDEDKAENNDEAPADEATDGADAENEE